jgi:transposase
MIVPLHEPGDLLRLRELVRTEPLAKQRDRYRVVLLAALGSIDRAKELERDAIARAAGRSRAFVDKWVKRYRDGGIDAVKAIEQPGKPCRLDADQQERFKSMLDAGPQPGVDGRCVFFAEDLCTLVEREFGVLYSASGMYKLLDRLGYSWLCPRPRNPRGDPAAQAAFKKRSSTRSMRFVSNAPTNAC